MKCPKCGKEQYCPCKACKDRLPKGKKSWVWIDGEIIACGYCGYAESASGWETREWNEFTKGKKYLKTKILEIFWNYLHTTKEYQQVLYKKELSEIADKILNLL